jgi:hypothetical protein
MDREVRIREWEAGAGCEEAEAKEGELNLPRSAKGIVP